MANLLQFALISTLMLGCAAETNESTPDARLARVDAGPQVQGDFSVVFQTTAGSFTVDVTRSWSPNGADRFRELVEDNFFDGARFFRVVPGFIVQFGLNGTPAVDATWSGLPISDDPVVESNLRGYITFAKTSEPNSRTSQLFINYIDNSFLDATDFTPFGIIRGNGMVSVDSINSEYGERPDQTQIRLQGNSYLDTNFPNLDKIETATIE